MEKKQGDIMGSFDEMMASREENGFDWDQYYSKGEDLYQQFASNDPVYDPRFENVPMFDKEGNYSQAYINAAGITKGVATSTGTNPRQTYFDRLFTQLESEMSTTQKQETDDIMLNYGDKPRYSKSEEGVFQLQSPFSVQKAFREETKGMDDFGLMEFTPDFYNMISSMPTDTSSSIEGNIIDRFKNDDEAPWGTTNTKYESGKQLWLGREKIMADIIDIGTTGDNSPLKTGDMRRSYNQSKCGKGFKSIKGKCVKMKENK